MIINFHPRELKSKKGEEIIARIQATGNHDVFHVLDKTAEEWKVVIAGTEKLILLGPVYWWGAGHDFDKWVQDVFSYGFAYKYGDDGMPQGLLVGREFEMHMTHGTPADYAVFMRDNIRARLEKGIFGFCDAKVAVTFYDLKA